MNLAVKLYASEIGNNPNGIPSSWPSETVSLGESTQLPSGEGWILMTEEEYNNYILENISAYREWELLIKNGSSPIRTPDVINYSISNSEIYTTQSNEDTKILGNFSVTPVIGTYLIIFSAVTSILANNTDLFCTVYIGGVPITESIRTVKSNSFKFSTILSTQTIQYCDGLQSVEVYVHRVGSGSMSIAQRSLALIRMG